MLLCPNPNFPSLLCCAFIIHRHFLENFFCLTGWVLIWILFCRYPYLTVVINFSQVWALYCLVQFYDVTHERLRHIKPLAKFISFKAIVFATWWQGVGIALLCAFRVLPKEGKLQSALQDFLICIEVSCLWWNILWIYLTNHNSLKSIW